jgi:hypothetical protein
MPKEVLAVPGNFILRRLCRVKDAALCSSGKLMSEPSLVTLFEPSVAGGCSIFSTQGSTGRMLFEAFTDNDRGWSKDETFRETSRKEPYVLLLVLFDVLPEVCMERCRVIS